MRKIGINELKTIQLDILSFVDNFCRENGIMYWLDLGTLLGAIRHHGYIPWDDDIDIGMLREDYNRFSELFNTQKSKYRFFCIENTKSFYCAYGKVADTKTKLRDDISDFFINIDVFVYDNVPDDNRILEKMYNKRDSLTKWFFRQKAPVLDRNITKKFIKKLMHSCLQILPEDYFMKLLVSNSKQYEEMDTKYVGNFTSVSRIKGDKKIFSSFVEVDFEGKKFWAPVGYDEWLTLFYHDYMQLPPEEKRVSHHEFEAYIIEN